MRRLFFLGVASFAFIACTASLDLDRFTKQQSSSTPNPGEGGPPTPPGIAYFDLEFSARDMGSHLNEYFEMRVVDKTNVVQAKVVFADVTKTDFTLYMQRIVPRENGPYRLDFWADHNNSFKYDGIVGGINEKDHAWRRSLVNPPTEEDVKFNAEAGRFEIDFPHNTIFIDILTDLEGNPIPGDETFLPFNLRVVGAAAYAGKQVETRVVHKASGRLVALHRRGRAQDTFTAQVTDVLDEDTAYEVSVYADVNGDGKFSAGDASWKVELSSAGAGIDGELNLASTPQGPIETGEL